MSLVKFRWQGGTSIYRKDLKFSIVRTPEPLFDSIWVLVYPNIMNQVDNNIFISCKWLLITKKNTTELLRCFCLTVHGENNIPFFYHMNFILVGI